ncbi:ORF6C domain-containing protein [Paenibacillus radicis (ex Xue et al. 2023)]|uniref:ORF6C domain-containing protein n=1 Tax=Paenibacillus radicis (ex Xue et al. 2023) TaxID=2972489 RepID=A0ABT1YMD8_9BACL|nr:ORF6C domain-containing protein [Paenibacillus radicis (ex Xue et al. 2023)]MCR8633448.1 ORF6C domain-containing protein [Paenibacillus radicis (ex Xue et al. 2023)]
MSLMNEPATPDYLPMIEKQLQMSEQQGAVLRSLFEGIRQMRDDVNEKVEEVQIMVQEVRDSVVLNDHEAFMVRAAVHAKSVELTKDRFKDSDEKFNAVVGRHRRMIWSKLKDRFEVAKYSHVRRIDYQESIEFVQSFRPEDYI